MAELGIDFTKVLEALINGIFGGGLALAIFNWIRLRKAKKAGISEVEHVAAVQTQPQAIGDPLTAYLRAELRKAQALNERLDKRIARL